MEKENDKRSKKVEKNSSVDYFTNPVYSDSYFGVPKEKDNKRPKGKPY